ncbi:MAG: acyl-CoA dehydrogenase family protein [Dehalococcoidia bacterium]
MDFGFDEIQEMIRNDARRFLSDKCPKSYVRQMEDDERGFTPELWKEMADLGWMGLVFPEKYGGQDMTFMELAVLMEEMGRACLPGPYFSTVILGGLPILEAGTEEQRQELLPKIAAGDIFMTLALIEPCGRYNPEGIEAKVTVDGDHYVIEGTKLFVLDAHVADHIICVARTQDNADKSQGISLFIVDANSPGVNCRLLKSIASDRECEVVFDKVVVPKENLLGDLNHGWRVVERTLTLAAAFKCAEMLGGSQQVLEMTVAYAKERKQFSRPIGSFQAVQHHCANMAADVVSSHFITYQACWMLSQGMSCDKQVYMAKAWVSDAYQRVTALGQQLHGAIGFTRDHDMQLYFRRAKAGEVFFGNSEFHREKVVQALAI